MRIPAKTDYGLRALLVLARHWPDLVTADVLVTEQALPKKYLAVILAHLRRQGLVRTQRGAGGGYALAMPADQLSLGTVLRLLNGRPDDRAPQPREAAHDDVARHLSTVWIAAEASLDSILEHTSLADVLAGTLPEHVRRIAAEQRIAGRGRE